MIYGSICSGIEAASVAWHPLGWKPAFLSEIDAFPRAVLAHRFPAVPLHGDFTTIEAGQYEPIDLLVGGTPCQSFSVAGLRGGLGDDRGNLALEYLRLADRLRPRWLVWENVPGVLSSGGGRDFGSILGGMGELGYGFAYRVLDAQYVRVDGLERAVPQRRRRVFVVGYLGDWRRAAAVLFERASLSGHPAPRREAGQSVARCLSPGAHPGGFNGQDAYDNKLIAFDTGQISSEANYSNPKPGDPCHPISARGHVPAIAFDARQSNVLQYGDKTGPLDTAGHTLAVAYGESHASTETSWVVRRLTPLEAERLQGFPEGWTDVPYRGKPASDGPRYKAIGNSMAVNVMRWLGRRIELVDGIASESAA
jgi:DNA (cytosine-5)-methyltransferase 1